MRSSRAAIILGAFLAAPSLAMEAQPPYFELLINNPDTTVEACHTSILAREDYSSPPCVATIWRIWDAQNKVKAERFDFKNKPAFRKIVAELTLVRNGKLTRQESTPPTKAVRTNIGIVVSVARDKLKDDNVTQCLAQIRYRNDETSPYCDYTLALLNLVLFTSADIPPLKLEREDMAAVLDKALPIE